MAYRCFICHEVAAPYDSYLDRGVRFVHVDCKPRQRVTPLQAIQVHIQKQEPPPRFIPVPYMRPMGMRV